MIQNPTPEQLESALQKVAKQVPDKTEVSNALSNSEEQMELLREQNKLSKRILVPVWITATATAIYALTYAFIAWYNFFFDASIDAQTLIALVRELISALTSTTATME